MKITKAQAIDLAERAAWTFVQAFLGVFGVVALGWLSQVVNWLTSGRSSEFPPVDGVTAAAVAGASAGLAAVIAVVKGFIATRFGNGTAATLPEKDEPIPPVLTKAEGGPDNPPDDEVPADILDPVVDEPEIEH